MRRIVSFAVLMATAAAGAGMAPPPPTLTFQQGSRVWLEGTSTVRGYRCETARVEGSAALSTDPTDLVSLSTAVRSATVTLPVASLDCRNATMNGHMRRALKAEQNPTIRFRATSIQITPANGTVRLIGPLSIAGGEQTVTLNGTVVRDAGGQVRVRGSKQLQMSQFGVQAPRLMMGTMRVHDDVTVNFDVLLRS